MRFDAFSPAFTIAIAAGAVFGAMACRPSDPGDLYSRRIKQFAQAAAALDSLGLRNLADSDAPVRWALDAARRQSAILTGLRGSVYVRIASTRADTATVVYHTLGECADRSVVVTFVGPPATSRVARVESDCAHH